MWRVFFKGVIACVCLLGCTQDREKTVEVPRFHEMPLLCDVAQISVSCTFRSTEVDPSIEHLVTPSFPEVVEKWAKKCFVASGTQGQMRVIIEEASISAFPVAEPQGFFASTFFSPKIQYTAYCVIKLEIHKAAHIPLHTHRVYVSVSKKAGRDISEENRDILLRAMMHNMLERLHTEVLNKAINTAFING
ncbi:MAG: hypothetical protein LBQ26_00320 [Holosporales bacterium]|jgi:hypothetical protein|nr:hypothetical protein [Holosporales bacterium]